MKCAAKKFHIVPFLLAHVSVPPKPKSCLRPWLNINMLVINIGLLIYRSTLSPVLDAATIIPSPAMSVTSRPVPCTTECPALCPAASHTAYPCAARSSLPSSSHPFLPLLLSTWPVLTFPTHLTCDPTHIPASRMAQFNIYVQLSQLLLILFFIKKDHWFYLC